MNLRHYLRRARELPPDEVTRRALRRLRSAAGARAERSRDRRRPTYVATSPGPLARLLPAPDVEALRPAADALLLTTGRSLEHEADLLGSGWVPLGYGVERAGLAGHRYPPEQGLVVDAAGRWLEGRVNPANIDEARSTWQLVSSGHEPIDWCVDLRSGFRWPATTWFRDVRYGDVLGADVKFPWELARAQHLPQLALAAALSAVDDRFAPAERYAAELQDQVLDFIATNPPRYGPNWRVAMDVGIRVANWLVAYDLFRAQGTCFDAEFERRLERSVVDHLDFLLANLEWDPLLRSNHYLADVAGLVFAAAYLPSSPRTDAALGFGVDQLVVETELQFGEDGANFEASTSYHRLSAEMVAYTTAVTLGLPADRVAMVEASDPALVRSPVPYDAPPRWIYVHAEGAARTPFPSAHVQRLEGMAAFTTAVTKPSGLVVQIGDNDSGRFLRLVPTLDGDREVVLDHGHLLGALNGLVAGVDVPVRVPPYEGSLLRALAHENLRRGQPRGATVPAYVTADLPLEPATRWSFEPGGADLTRDLRLEVFPDFGLYIWRSGRLFLSLRCGSVGQRGNGGHAHNDQLGVELSIDGDDWVRDPGTFVYTPLPAVRNRYRSVTAHFAPRSSDGEPAPLDLGLFRLPDTAGARLIRLSPTSAVAGHEGWGRQVVRHVLVESHSVVVADHWLGGAVRASDVVVRSAAEARSLWDGPPFSPGYGLLSGPAEEP